MKKSYIALFITVINLVILPLTSFASDIVNDDKYFIVETEVEGSTLGAAVGTAYEYAWFLVTKNEEFFNELSKVWFQKYGHEKPFIYQNDLDLLFLYSIVHGVFARLQDVQIVTTATANSDYEIDSFNSLTKIKMRVYIDKARLLEALTLLSDAIDEEHYQRYFSLTVSESADKTLKHESTKEVILISFDIK